MNKGPPQAINLCLRTKHTCARRNPRLNQNLNREPWFATFDILNTVEFDVNPVFSTLKDRLCQPVPLSDRTGVVNG